MCAFTCVWVRVCACAYVCSRDHKILFPLLPVLANDHFFSFIFYAAYFDHSLLLLPAPSDHLHLSTNPAASSFRSCSHKKENKKEKMKANKQTKPQTYQTKTKPKAHPEKHGAHCVLASHSWHEPCPRVFDMLSVIPWRRLISSFPT